MDLIKKIFLSLSLPFISNSNKSITNRADALKNVIKAIEKSNNNSTSDNKILLHSSLSHEIKVVFSSDLSYKIVHASSNDSETIRLFKNSYNERKESLLYSININNSKIKENVNPDVVNSKNLFIKSVLGIMSSDSSVFNKKFLA